MYLTSIYKGVEYIIVSLHNYSWGEIFTLGTRFRGGGLCIKNYVHSLYYSSVSRRVLIDYIMLIDIFICVDVIRYP